MLFHENGLSHIYFTVISQRAKRLQMSNYVFKKNGKRRSMKIYFSKKTVNLKPPEISVVN